MTSSMNSDQGLRCVVMRGGTTRGLFFHAGDLPSDPAERDGILMAAVGGPDPRQVDGIGGADLLLSKVAMVWPSTRADVHVECQFGSITPGSGTIKYGANCGNLASAVACFARDEGLVAPSAEVVRVYNPDSQTTMEARLHDLGTCCEARLQGMPATGSTVELTFLEPAGTASNALLPTGRPRDDLQVPGGGRISASIVDSGAMYVFVRASDLGISQPVGGDRFRGDPELMDALEQLRGQAAVMAGLASSPAEALAITPAVPKLALVGPPMDYCTEGTDLAVDRRDVDLVGRIVSSQSIHKAYAVTGAIATASAAMVRGSIVHELVGEGSTDRERGLRIGHPTGIIRCAVTYSRREAAVHVRSATVWRTARRIMEGRIYLPARGLETLPPRFRSQPAEPKEEVVIG